jgi:two-component system sensor histidine kinase HydH
MVEDRATPAWMDLIWLFFLVGLALLPPIHELHKQVILLALGVLQFIEKPLVRGSGEQRGPILAVLVKLTLATVLLNHTRDASPILSSYWPVFFVPVTTAAIYFGPLGTLLWTSLTSAAYCAYLIPAMKEYELDWTGGSQLLMRILFFYLVGMTVNRFVVEYRVQVQRYRLLSQSLAEANRELRLAQEEARRAERLAALGQLSAGLAHEIRNPLGVIKGSAEILNQKLEGSDGLARELSGYIYTEVNRVSALVSRFLDFARPTRLELHAEQVPPLLEACIKAATDQGATTKVNIVREYAAGLPEVMMDRELCEQVFTNLILNACEAMGEQGGTLKIRIDHETQPTAEVWVEIEDSGPGIAPELKEQIFNPFVSTKKTGVGLGLAIVTKIVDAHGGTVRVESLPGQGACFRVTLPAAVATPAQAEKMKV